jgi:5-methyltetrahydropteroyltriglutamate--homocysteine methyltransferase
MPILSTHVGSLPRPADLLPYIRGDKEPPADYAEQLAAATEAVLKRQEDAGIHYVNDGELGRRDYVTSARKRMTGFDALKAAVGAGDLEEMTEYSDKFEGRKGLLTLTKKTEVKNAACGGPIAYTEEGKKDLQEEIDRVAAACKARGLPLDRVFFSSPSAGTLATFFDDDYFHDHQKYVAALGAAMKTEYDMIAKAGFLLQVDCPDLAMGRHTRFKEKSLEEFRTAIKGNVATMSAALADIPAERIRMHLCWGNYPGPHHHDVPLQDVIDIVLTCKPKFISIEACNPGHAHEWEVFETVVWPEDKVVMPGVIDTTTSHIEHPRLVAQRLMNYVRFVGADRVIACWTADSLPPPVRRTSRPTSSTPSSSPWGPAPRLRMRWPRRRRCGASEPKRARRVVLLTAPQPKSRGSRNLRWLLLRWLLPTEAISNSMKC